MHFKVFEDLNATVWFDRCMAIVQAKVLEHPSSSGLQDELNAFLRTIDDAQLKDIKFSSHAVMEGNGIKETYTAIVIYTSEN
jgi:hypothetical protein